MSMCRVVLFSCSIVPCYLLILYCDATSQHTSPEIPDPCEASETIRLLGFTTLHDSRRYTVLSHLSKISLER